MLLLLLVLACGGNTPSSPPSGPPTPAAEVKPPEPPPAAAVGPDGPVSIQVPLIAAVSTDPAAVAAGSAVFAARGCGACHKFGEKLVGPDLKGILTRRTTPWVERMVSEPELMTKQDPVAKDLFRSAMVQMTKQGVTAEELPNLLAYMKAQ